MAGTLQFLPASPTPTPRAGWAIRVIVPPFARRRRVVYRGGPSLGLISAPRLGARRAPGPGGCLQQQQEPQAPQGEQQGHRVRPQQPHVRVQARVGLVHHDGAHHHHTVRAASRSAPPPMGGSIRFRPPTYTYAPWGCIARADELPKSRETPTRKLPLARSPLCVLCVFCVARYTGPSTTTACTAVSYHAYVQICCRSPTRELPRVRTAWVCGAACVWRAERVEGRVDGRACIDHCITGRQVR